MAKVNVVIMIGVAGSGKSSLVKELREKSEKATFSFESDWYRQHMYGSLEEGNKHNKEVFEKMNEEFFGMVEWCNGLDVGSEIYYDATNLSRRKRRYLYNTIQRMKCDVKVTALVVFASLETLFQVNETREEHKRVPKDVVERMYKNIQIPRVGADCDTISMSGESFFSRPIAVHDSRISVFERLLFSSNNQNFLKEVERIEESHNNPHHLESISEHIDMCIENANTITMENVAFFHDLGKSLCKETFEDGISRYRNHANVSAYYYLNYIYSANIDSDRYYKQGVLESSEFANGIFDVAEIIYEHMLGHIGLGDKNIKNNKLSNELIEKIYAFAEIDSKSRITELKS